MKSRGDFTPFLTEPISGAILILTISVVFFTALNELKKLKIRRQQLAAG